MSNMEGCGCYKHRLVNHSNAHTPPTVESGMVMWSACAEKENKHVQLENPPTTRVLKSWAPEKRETIVDAVDAEL